MVTMPYVMDSKDGRGYDLFSRLLKMISTMTTPLHTHGTPLIPKK